MYWFMKMYFVSDPPFNIGYHYDKYHDKMDDEDYYNWLFDIFWTQNKLLFTILNMKIQT